MCEIVIIGGGGHAKVIASILRKLNNYKVLGYTDIVDQGKILSYPYLGNDDFLQHIIKENSDISAVIGLGMLSSLDASKREMLYEKVCTLGFQLPAIISPDAIMSDEVKIGNGTVVMNGAVVNVGTIVGECVIVNTHSTVDHDCVIENNSHIGPGATLSGGVKVGKNALIGASAVITEYRNIADNVTIGAGTVVVKDCVEPGTYVGVPARKTS